MRTFIFTFFILASTACNRGSVQTKADFEQCLSKINSFTEEELFNRFIKRPSKIIDYGDERKFVVSDRCSAQRSGKLKGRESHCENYELFEKAEATCLKGSLTKCTEAIHRGVRIQANSFHLQKKACQLGDQHWCSFVALREDFSKNTKAVFQKSCDQNKHDGCLHLGIILWNSQRAAAMKVFEKVRQWHEVISFFERVGAVDEQMAWLGRDCDKGHRVSCLELGYRNRDQRINDIVRNGCYLSTFEER